MVVNLLRCVWVKIKILSCSLKFIEVKHTIYVYTYMKNLGVDGWIILGWISRRWDVGI